MPTLGAMLSRYPTSTGGRGTSPGASSRSLPWSLNLRDMLWCLSVQPLEAGGGGDGAAASSGEMDAQLGGVTWRVSRVQLAGVGPR